jgi:hypothetical protein
MEQKGVVIFVLNVEQAIKNFTAMSVDKKISVFIWRKRFCNNKD